MFVPGAVLTPAIGDADYTENAMRLLGWHAALYQTTDRQLAGEMQWTWKRAGSPVRDTGANAWPLLPFLYTDGDLPSTPVDLKSTTISTLGYEILRNDVGTPSEDYLVMVNPSRALGHQHDDRTSFSLWADRTPLSLDSGVGGYFNGDNVWFNSASAHNVVQFAQAGGTWSGTPATVTVTDRYRSDLLDYVRVGVSSTYDRHIASIKGDVDAYVIWDRSDGTQASRFNLHTLSTSITGTGSHLVAHGYNEKDLDIDVLGDDAPAIKLDSGRISGQWPQRDQQWLQIGAAAGRGHLLVLYPRDRAAAGLNIRQVATGAYELTTPGGARVIVAVNPQAQDTTASLPIEGSFTDLRNGQTRVAQSGTLSVPIPGRGMTVFKG